MENKKHYRKVMYLFLGCFLAIVIGIILYSTYIYIFNHTERTFSAGEVNDDFTINIAPRSGQTDSWDKKVTENGKVEDYNGSIYDVTMNNVGSCNITLWKLYIDIDKPCYLNNSWCGTVEIHQNVNEEEKSQTIDLRNYDIEDLKLDYKIADPDLLIPLNKGDYIIYYPDYKTDEYPIKSGDNEKLTQVVIGMILYNKGDSSLEFTQYHLAYYLEKNYTKSWVFWILCFLLAAWVIGIIIFATIEINMRKAQLRFKQDEKIIRQSIGVFTRFFEAKDTYTNGHSQRVAKYSRMIAEQMEFSEEECRQIYYIGLMHDCGKSYIPDEILKKPGKLTNEEFEVIKSHTIKGAEMLEDFTAIDHMRDGVLYHHERYDGKGYPAGLTGKEIPMIARIICVADSFDAMNSRRCYRDMLSNSFIISEFEKNSGKQFDPEIVKVFLKLVDEGKIEFTKND